MKELIIQGWFILQSLWACPLLCNTESYLLRLSATYPWTKASPCPGFFQGRFPFTNITFVRFLSYKPFNYLMILLLYNLQIFSSEMIYSTDIFTFVFMTSFRSLFSFRLTHEHSSSLFPSQRWNIYQQKVLETKPFNIKHQKHQILFWEIIFRGAIFCGGGL